MGDLQGLQQRFMSYLRNADLAIEADISGASEDERARRLSIYYNAYRIRLRGSIETDHPVLGIYLGDTAFDQMAADFIDHSPSRKTSLRHFCDDLPGFLESHEAFSEHGILSELARFERLLMDVFDAADQPALDPGVLSSLSAEQWPQLTVKFHPSTRVFVTSWNVVEVWQAIKGERTPPDAMQSAGQAWLMWRNRERLTEFRSLPVDEYTMLSNLLDGGNFANVCDALLEWHAEEEVAARALRVLQEYLRTGLVVNLA